VRCEPRSARAALHVAALDPRVVIGHTKQVPAADRTPNIRDVARLAGVSHQTVSRALNDSPSLRAGTRERVLHAIEQLGYRPNQAARALSSKRSRLIGVLSTQTGHYGPSKSVQAIESAARDAGYQLTVSNIAADSSDGIRAGLDALVLQRVEAIVVVAPQLRTVEAIRDLSIDVPFVTLEATGLDQVHGLSVDQVGGARLAVRHLVRLGHERIAHVSGPLDWVEARARVAGYEAELAASGLAALPVLEGDWTAEAGFRLGRELLDPSRLGGQDAPTAVFAANDQLALGLLHAASTLHLAVPREVSIVGFDDMPEAAHFLPPLTTVRQDFTEIGRRAMARLVAALGGVEAPPDALIHPELVVRESTSPPATG
jgi:DNA-binding LacI/PurR family transcriptional regulator